MQQDAHNTATVHGSAYRTCVLIKYSRPVHHHTTMSPRHIPWRWLGGGGRGRGEGGGGKISVEFKVGGSLSKPTIVYLGQQQTLEITRHRAA